MERRIDPLLLREDTIIVMEQVRREISRFGNLMTFDLFGACGGALVSLAAGFWLFYVWGIGEDSLLVVAVPAVIGLGVGAAITELLFCRKARADSISKLKQLAKDPRVQNTIKEVARLRRTIRTLQHLGYICSMLEQPFPVGSRSARRIFQRTA